MRTTFVGYDAVSSYTWTFKEKGRIYTLRMHFLVIDIMTHSQSVQKILLILFFIYIKSRLPHIE